MSFVPIPKEIKHSTFRDINVLIGNGQDDVELVFGQISQGEECYTYDSTNLSALLRDLKIFESSSEAFRNGFKGDIPKGYSQLMFKKKFTRITIWNTP